MHPTSWFKSTLPVSPESPTLESLLADAQDEANKFADVEKAWQQIGQREYENARKLLQDVVAGVPQHYTRIWETVDIVYLKAWDQTELQSSIAYMKHQGCNKQIVGLYASYPRAFYQLGYVCYELGDYEGAINYLDHGLSLDPDHPQLCIEKAQALMRLDKPNEALQVWDRLLDGDRFSTDREVAVCLRGKAYALIELGELDPAEELLKETLVLEPDSELSLGELEYIAELRDVINRFGVNGAYVNRMFKSYSATFSITGFEEWHSHIAGIGRDLGALTEVEIERGKTSFTHAIMNRVKVKCAAMHFAVLHHEELGITPRVAEELSMIVMVINDLPPDIASTELAQKLRAIYLREVGKLPKPS